MYLGPVKTITLSLLLAAQAASAQTTYYVAEGGNDGADGSSGSPWATLQQAADTVAAGDTVVVRAGTYQGFNLETSGTDTMPITFRAEAGVTIDSDNPVTPDGINLEGASFVVIDGFTVIGTSRAGIRAVTCEHVTIRNNRADMNGRWGILTGFCNDLLIENNECSRSVDEHGIYVSNSGDRPHVRGNRLWGNNANGLHMNGDIFSPPGDGIISNALVEENVIWDNGLAGGSGINCDGVQDSVIWNNLLYGNHASGISLYQIDGGGPSTGNLVANNTVINASDARWAMNIQDGATGNSLRNNIFFNENTGRGSIDISADSVDGLISDYNVVGDLFSLADTFVSLAEWRAMTGQDANSVQATIAEVFADRAGDDYHLSVTSPAIDVGTTTEAPPSDFEGQARPLGAGVDIGADEHCPDPCAMQVDAGMMGGSDAGPGFDAGSGTDAGMSATDAGGGGPDDGGCSCRAGARSSAGGWLLLSAFALARHLRGARPTSRRDGRSRGRAPGAAPDPSGRRRPLP